VAHPIRHRCGGSSTAHLRAVRPTGTRSSITVIRSEARECAKHRGYARYFEAFRVPTGTMIAASSR
jgi:hypothetical protein